VIGDSSTLISLYESTWQTANCTSRASACDDSAKVNILMNSILFCAQQKTRFSNFMEPVPFSLAKLNNRKSLFPVKFTVRLDSVEKFKQKSI
jgi:hypothetical protein